MSIRRCRLRSWSIRRVIQLLAQVKTHHVVSKELLVTHLQQILHTQIEPIVRCKDCFGAVEEAPPQTFMDSEDLSYFKEAVREDIQPHLVLLPSDIKAKLQEYCTQVFST
mgnify:CR=1 FL=1